MYAPMKKAALFLVLSSNAAFGHGLPADMVRDQTCDESSERTPRGLTPQIIYLNMEGGTFVQGSENPGANRCTLVQAGTAQVSAFQPAEPEKRARMLRCMQLMFGRFNAIVTDVEPPSTTPYIEGVITGGSSQEIGLENSILGIAHAPCDPLDNAIVWVFGAFYDNDVQSTCETAAQEIAHAFGLDHEVICEDPMTYESGCHPKTFQDRDARCGEYQSTPQRDCYCTGASQNSVQELITRLGPGELIPPVVSITSPAEGATLTGSFTVQVDAQDNYVVATTELYVDDVMITSADLPPYEMIVPKTIMPGTHTIEVRAFDANNNSASTMITITTEAECAGDGDCQGEGQRCNEWYCVGDLGAVCQGHEDCSADQRCGAVEGENRCTVSCVPSSPDCPSGFECVASIGGASGQCWPGGGEGGCGCVVGARLGGVGAGLGALLLGGVGLVLARRRRRRA
jgi:hypothetical protein